MQLESKAQRDSVPSAEAEAAAVERLRRRLEAHVAKLHGLTPAQANGPLLDAIAAASVGLGMAAQRLAAYEAAEVNRVQSEGPLQRGAGVAEPADAEEVAEEVKKLGDQLVRGWCAEESEEPQWLLEAERVVAAGRPHSEAELTPVKELLCVPRPKAKEGAAVRAQRCLHMGTATGKGAGEAGEEVEGMTAAAVIQLQRVVRGLAVRRMLEQKLLVRRRMEASARLVVREAEERARREAQRDAARRAKEQARREAGLAEAKLDARAEARQAEARCRRRPREMAPGGEAEGSRRGHRPPRKEGHFCQDRYGDWWRRSLAKIDTGLNSVRGATLRGWQRLWSWCDWTRRSGGAR